MSPRWRSLAAEEVLDLPLPGKKGPDPWLLGRRGSVVVATKKEGARSSARWAAFCWTGSDALANGDEGGSVATKEDGSRSTIAWEEGADTAGDEGTRSVATG